MTVSPMATLTPPEASQTTTAHLPPPGALSNLSSSQTWHHVEWTPIHSGCCRKGREEWQGSAAAGRCPPRRHRSPRASREGPPETLQASCTQKHARVCTETHVRAKKRTCVSVCWKQTSTLNLCCCADVVLTHTKFDNRLAHITGIYVAQ